jgi:hypothetical protein
VSETRRSRKNRHQHGSGSKCCALQEETTVVRGG